MDNLILSSATIGIVISLLAYEIGLAAQRKWKLAILNPLLISIGVFIILNALREKRRWALGAVTNLEEKRQIIRRGAMEESWITAGKEVSLWEIARRFHKNRYTVVRVVDERMRPLGTVYEDRILDCILRGEREKTLGELVRSG